MYHRKSGVFNLPFSSFTDPLLTHQPHWRFFFFDVQDRRSDDQFDPLIRSLRCLFCGYAGEDYRQNYRYQLYSSTKDLDFCSCAILLAYATTGDILEKGKLLDGRMV
jgi:hypothetical protein